MRLIKIKDDQFRLCNGSMVIEGNEALISEFLIKDCGIASAELDFALSEMKEKHHDVASFGVLGTVVCTFKNATTEGLVSELQAIQNVRKEFHVQYKNNPGALETGHAAYNLQSLYIQLNVDGLLDVLKPDRIN